MVFGETYLPLYRKVAVASGDAEKEGVKVDEVVGEKNRVVWARRCPDELQNVLGEGFLDPIWGVGRQDSCEVE